MDIVKPVYAEVEALVIIFQSSAVICLFPTRPAAFNSDAVIINCALAFLFPPWKGEVALELIS